MLLTDHLDPGYAAAAAAREAGDRPRQRFGDFAWMLVGAGAIALVLPWLLVRPRPPPRPPGKPSTRWQAGYGRLRSVLTRPVPGRDALVDLVDAERRSRLGMDKNGQRLLGSLDMANLEAAAIPCRSRLPLRSPTPVCPRI